MPKPHGVSAAGNAAGLAKNEVDDNPFSQYYGMLLHQQNMLQDHVRTSTYERAMLQNASDFNGKVVLDVGTGSGILAYFAIKAGAKRVYAVELSAMAECARKLMDHNGMANKIVVIKGKMEDVKLPEKVDIVISEPMGFFLVHERMLETYVLGRTKWMKPGGLMFPSTGTMFVCPFTDDSIYQEQMAKVSFWRQQNFYGLDLNCLVDEAMENHFSQPIVGYFSPSILMASAPVERVLDFRSITEDEFHTFDIPFRFECNKTAIMHGLACWFTVDFIGTNATVVLSTGPWDTGTHWYQCRLLLKQPIAVNSSQAIYGNLHFTANNKFSYDIEMEVILDGTAISSATTIRLQDQMYHYMHSS
ncbi:hypothetical protein H310_07002 [Aphanomyces invadans]|uniref:type I protein arginine methyltransferase n=1 Tax=Aphanomyces invadans TaxID=157072 RepID=A0A024U1Q9_9STRA|nr:hypothetical protein H310_07002 [Aphanomyces invadans]ETW00356.1 hypothetical protein H310_07002 [Aphanomyces invadans]|eukprot:XP_008870491.1 hypothetical protein H310_07002 [Aphanomyces invadans]